MPPKFAHGLKACCVAVTLLLAVARAAEPAPPSPLLGLTRDEVVNRNGDPKSQIVAGNRLVMFYAKERLVLRDGVVVEVERLGNDRRLSPPPATVPATAAPAAAPTAPADATKTPAAPAAPVERAASSATAPAPGVAASAPAPGANATETVSPNVGVKEPAVPEPKLEIKTVRPPSSNYARPTPPPGTTPVRSPAVPAASESERKPDSVGTTPAEAAVSPAVPGVNGDTPATDPAAPSAAPREGMTPSSRSALTAAREAAAAHTAIPDVTEAEEAAKQEALKQEEAAALAAKEKEKKVKVLRARRRLEDASTPEAPTISEAFMTPRTFVIGAIVIGGLIYLFWRSRQKQLVLAATAVSRTPFSAPPSAGRGSGPTFNGDFLSKLEWKRFEELVAAYYSKTGVVAVRTKTGPATPVNIKISWKGEPRPFACVQCLAHPTGLIDAAPLHELVTVLSAEDIRRGYVVSTGKFNVPARDFAEEKHLTLLPGDIFLEKLNALPDTARSEIMQSITTGDFETPSCPKCDAKMGKSPDDPTKWRCPNHHDQLIPTWK